MITICELDLPLLEGYRQLRLRALKEEPTAFTTSLEEEANKSERYWEERLHSPLYRICCAVKEKQVVGMSGCRFEAKEKKLHKATLIAVYVDPEFRQRGIGRILIKTSLSAAFEAPHVTRVNLSVTSSNVPAIGLYTSLGFEKWGEESQAIRVNQTYYATTYMEMSRERWKNSTNRSKY